MSTITVRGRRKAKSTSFILDWRGGGLDRVLFEAPRKDQQAWLIRAFGPDVNLANIAPGETLALETLRLGLRADTCDLTSQWLSV